MATTYTKSMITTGTLDHTKNTISYTEKDDEGKDVTKTVDIIKCFEPFRDEEIQFTIYSRTSPDVTPDVTP